MDIVHSILDTVDPLPAFRDLTIDDRPLFLEWMQEHNVKASNLTFAELYTWRGSRPARIARYNEFLLLVRFESAERPEAQSPIGRGDVTAAANALLDYLAAEYPQTELNLARVPDPPANMLREASFLVEEDRDNFDYVYRVNDLAKLKGRKYDKKRNRIHKCLAACECTYEPITSSNLDGCFQLEEEWCNIRQCELNPALSAEFRAIKEALDEFDTLELFGGAIRIDGRIQAFAVAERVGVETAVEHFEKANPQINGLYQVMNQRFCQHALEGLTWVNREQDLGIKGLRQAKMSYHPDHLLKKYTVRRAT